MRGGKEIGNEHEREVCYLLSKWFSYRKDDGLFWRSDTSGGRATSKSKKGIIEPDLFGDITHRKPEGRPLIKLILLEAKKGYTHDTNPLEFFENTKTTNLLYIHWTQAERDREIAGRKYSWLIFGRKRKRILLMFDYQFFCDCEPENGEYEGQRLRILDERRGLSLVIVDFKKFLEYLDPMTIHSLGGSNDFFREET